jgi:hypothetical protein
MAPSAVEPPPLKILMLHGYSQSGPLFRAKTRALEKNLQKAILPATTSNQYSGVSLYYLTAPHVLSGVDIPNWDPTSATIGASALNGSKEAMEEARIQVETEPEAYGWWRRREDSFLGLEEGFEEIAKCLVEQGPFDGVIGFSQGASMAGMITALLEKPYEARQEAFAVNQREGMGMSFPASFIPADGKGRIHPPLRFAAAYSGFASPFAVHAAFYNPKIQTPMLHVIGSLDTVVSEKRSLALVEACAGLSRVVYHPGGHFVPSSQKEYVGALIAFIKEAISLEPPAQAKEEGVEDMDLPF